MGDESTEVTGLYVPEYGPVRRLFEYVLFYVVVDRLTELLVGLFAEEMFTDISSASRPLGKALAVLGTDLGVLAAFTVGFVLLAYGVDRLLIGLAREVQYRRHVGSP